QLCGPERFFYVWLRRCLGHTFPDIFATALTPKAPELVAAPSRHGGSSDKAERHFRDGFASFYSKLSAVASSDVPITIYYAFRQSEDEEDAEGDATTASTGWDSMLQGLVDGGFQVTGTWPVRTTKKARSVARGTNALASAIVIVCRLRPTDASVATRREFMNSLREELPESLRNLQRGNIAPVDLAQAAIGPGMAVFTRYSRVLDAE